MRIPRSWRHRVAIVGAGVMMISSVGLGGAAANEVPDQPDDHTPAEVTSTPEAEPAPTPSPRSEAPSTSSPQARQTTPPSTANDGSEQPTAPANEADEVAEAETGLVEVENASFRWGLSNESNNAAFNPGTVNHFSAGRIQDPGEGNVMLNASDAAEGAQWSNGRPAGWSASRGNVRIEKYDGNGSYRLATYGDRRTTPAGGSIAPPGTEAFSDHQFVFDAGEGWVDLDEGTAQITWEGDVTVLYYSGMSFFYLSDPVLTVDASGDGRITATASGFASSMDDMTVWDPVAPRDVVVADLGQVDLSDGRGFEATPRYSGVSNGKADQVTSGEHWGSFPRSFVDFTEIVGSGPYWYSSGSQVDRFKRPLPLQISYDARNPIDGTTPPPPGDGGDGGDDGDGGDPGQPIDPTDPDDGATPVDNASFRWGLSNESNNAAFNPGTVNHFSAGKLRDPGEGNMTLTSGGARWQNGNPAGWSASRGNVRIEKYDGNGNYRRATFADRLTTPGGDSITPPISEAFSDHQFVFNGGEGWVDLDDGTAQITWKGDVTVLYYSGMSFFYLSDPTLTIDERGRGQITAVGSGFASSMDNVNVWNPVSPRRVVIADLGQVDLSDERGFEETPRYSGVRNGRSDQVTSGAHWGSFPRSFVDFTASVGSAQYWYSSGGSVDRFKRPLPLQVSYDANNPIAGTAPASAATEEAEPVNTFIGPPTGGGQAPAAPASQGPPATGTAEAPEAADDAFTLMTAPVRLSAAGTDTFPYSDVHWAWWAAGTLLLAASVALAGTGLVVGRDPTGGAPVPVSQAPSSP